MLERTEGGGTSLPGFEAWRRALEAAFGRPDGTNKHHILIEMSRPILDMVVTQTGASKSHLDSSYGEAGLPLRLALSSGCHHRGKRRLSTVRLRGQRIGSAL